MAAKLPNLILLGAQKSGSTAVYDWLSQHPDIYGNPAMKDFPFFCDPRYFERGLDWFSNHFKGHRDEAYVLHGYVHYLFLGHDVAQRLHEYNPDLRLVVLLRNPVERAFSGWLQARKTGNEPNDTFEDAIRADQEGRLSSLRERVDRSYLSHGRYASQLEHYLRVFPADQLHIALFDDVQNQPLATCRALFDFLRINSDFKPRFNKKNVYGKPRIAAVENLIQRGIPSATLHKLMPLTLRSRLRQVARSLNTVATNKPEMNAVTREWLQAYYAEELQHLQHLSGLDLQCWEQSHPASIAPSAP